MNLIGHLLEVYNLIKQELLLLDQCKAELLVASRVLWVDFGHIFEQVRQFVALEVVERLLDTLVLILDQV